MRTDYGDVFRDAHAVEKYETEIYAPDTYSSAVHRRQRAYLRALVRSRFADRRPVQHDFACGTGRAVRMLGGLVRAAHGYDTSPAMLDRARAAGLYARWHEIPETGPVPQPVPDGPPAIVTVLRLLLNVPGEVRDRALDFAAHALKGPEDGLLVLENHGNATSLRHLRHRARAGHRWYAELHHREVDELLARHGFQLVERRGFGFAPPGAYKRKGLRVVARTIDDFLCRVGLFSGWATDVLYVARRAGDVR
jgi:SAM-dependent methyltransferase